MIDHVFGCPFSLAMRGNTHYIQGRHSLGALVGTFLLMVLFGLFVASLRVVGWFLMFLLSLVTGGHRDKEWERIQVQQRAAWKRGHWNR